MEIIKRPATMVVAAVVALAMVSPSAALATDGDGRGHGKGTENSQRTDRDGEHDRDGKHGRADKAKSSRQASTSSHEANRSGHDESDERARADNRPKQAKHNKSQPAKRSNAHAEQTQADQKQTKSSDEKNAEQTRSSTAKIDRGTKSHQRDTRRDDEVEADSRQRSRTESRRTDMDEASSDGGPWNVKAPLCHATSSETNPYVRIRVSHKSIVKGTGHGGHANDIIPPFDYQPWRGAETERYDGLNWDAEGQELYANGCDADSDVGGDSTDNGDDGDEVDGDRSNGGPWNVKASLCHATNSETHPYVYISVSHRAIVNDAGHGAHADDIIPIFSYVPRRGADSVTYDGLNWDAEGQELYANGCDADSDVGGDSTDNGDDNGDNGGGDVDGDGETDVDGDGETDVDGDGETDVEGEAGEDVLGVVFDNDEDDAVGGDQTPTGDEVLNVGADQDDSAPSADTEVQASQLSDDDASSMGALAMTGLPIAALLIAGLLSLLAGSGLLRRRS